MNARANKILLLVSSLATFALLGWAAVDENALQEWRRLQRDYKKRLPADLAADFKVQLRQVVVPSLHVTDRCVTCHVWLYLEMPYLPTTRASTPMATAISSSIQWIGQRNRKI